MIIIFVIIALSILILVHELGHFLSAKFFGVKVEEFGLGFPPRLFSKKIGETVYSVNLLPFGGFVKIYGEDGGQELAEPARSFAAQAVWRRSAMVLAGIFMNIVLGWLVLSAVFMIGAPEHLAVAEVASDSPAAVAGLKGGDFILEVRGAGMVLQDPIASENLINLVSGPALGQEIELKLQRGSDVFDVALVGRTSPPQGEGPLGVVLVTVGFPPTAFFQALVEGAKATVVTLGAVVVAFVNFFATVFVNQEVLESVAGPVGIFALASQVGSLGAVYFLQLMALISLNLAILNLIPFPALDGGRFLFLLFERIKGSPVSPRLQTVVNSFGFVILIVLMVLVTIRDIGRIIN